jgi:hypothetical protein
MSSLTTDNIEKLKKINLSSSYDNCNNYTIYDKNIYLLIPNPERYMSLYHYLYSGQKLYTLEDIISGKVNRTYTYVLIERIINGIKSYELYARPIYTTLETFGKHNNIFKFILYKYYGIQGIELYNKYKDGYHNEENILNKNINILFSGELKYLGSNKIQYNFASGTYMKQRFKNVMNETIDKYSESFENILSTITKGIEYIYNNDIKDELTNKNLILEEITDIWMKIKDIDNSLKIYFIDNQELCYSLTIEGKKVSLLGKQNEKLLRININNFIKKYSDIEEIKSLNIDILDNEDYLNEILIIIDGLIESNPRNKNSLTRIKKNIESYSRYLILTNIDLREKYPDNVERIL